MQNTRVYVATYETTDKRSTVIDIGATIDVAKRLAVEYWRDATGRVPNRPWEFDRKTWSWTYRGWIDTMVIRRHDVKD